MTGEIGLPDFCPECGGKSLREETCPGTHRVGVREVRIDRDHHFACLDCGEWSYPGPLAGDLQTELTLALRAANGFVSLDDLRRARMRYGFTQAEMEKLLRVGEKTWVRWERGKVPPSAAIDREIRRFLSDASYVGQMMDENGVENESAREVVAEAVARAQDAAFQEAAPSLTAMPQEQARAATERIVREFSRGMASAFEPQQVSSADPQAVIRRHSARLPVDVGAIARDLGIPVMRDPNLGKDISGKIMRELRQDGSSEFVIYVNSREAPVRQRYTVAHEVAHFVRHRDLIGNGITENALHRGPFSNPQEREANALAAEILMPAEAVRAHHARTPAVLELARAFGVSGDAMGIRLRELGLQAG